GQAAAPGRPPTGSGLVRLIAVLIRWWALFGGVIVAALAVMTAASAASNLAFNRPFPPDYELVKHFVAIAIFAFLPYCQLTGANVTVDIFTERMPERGKAAMVAAASVLAVAFSLLLLTQMSAGFAGYVRYREVTPVLGLPLWTAFPFILFSLALLLAASLITLYQGWRGMRGLPPSFVAEALPPLE
ncbi:MAG TPA: TRAP transporter small permease, partial [Afifellaceae bacterium]|nr:TRAP transporter small permease [Afifellaceae bacterium]